MNTVQKNWEEYLKDVVPGDASEIQKTETQRAFYAGAFSAICILTGMAAKDISEDAGVAIIQGLLDECQAFKRDQFV